VPPIVTTAGNRDTEGIQRVEREERFVRQCVRVGWWIELGKDREGTNHFGRGGQEAPEDEEEDVMSDSINGSDVYMIP